MPLTSSVIWKSHFLWNAPSGNKGLRVHKFTQLGKLDDRFKFCISYCFLCCWNYNTLLFSTNTISKCNYKVSTNQFSLPTHKLQPSSFSIGFLLHLLLSWIEIVGSEGLECCEVGEGLVWIETMSAQLIRVFRVLNSSSFLLTLRSFLNCLRQFQLLKWCSLFVVRCYEILVYGLRRSFLVMSCKVFS